MFRRLGDRRVELLLAHPGGPYWTRRDAGAWTVPKGEIEAGELPLAAACREFQEETGFTSSPPYRPLGEVRQKAGKIVEAWAFEGDADPAGLRSNTMLVEWPPRSGRQKAFPEVDQVGWFTPEEAKAKLLESQWPFVQRLLALLEED